MKVPIFSHRSTPFLGWERVVCPEPRNLEEADRRLFDRDLVYAAPPVSVHLLCDALVWTHPIVEHGGRRFYPASSWSPQPFSPHGPFSLVRLAGALRRPFSAEYATLAYDGWSKNSLYHWLVDSLPRLLAAEAVAGCSSAVLLPDSPAPIAEYQEQTLKWIGWEGPRIRLRGLKPARVRHLLVPDCVAVAGRQRPGLIQELRHRLTRQIAPVNGLPRRLFISRRKAGCRRAAEEDGLHNLAEAKGFAVVDLEDHTPEQQARYLMAADFVAGIHGGGFANLLYCRPGTKVFEIRNSTVTDFNCYLTLAGNLNLPFYYFKAHPVRAEMANLSDLQIDLRLLSKALDHFLSGS